MVVLAMPALPWMPVTAAGDISRPRAASTYPSVQLWPCVAAAALAVSMMVEAWTRLAK